MATSDLIKQHIPCLKNEPQLTNSLDVLAHELNRVIEKINNLPHEKRIIVNFQIENKNGISNEEKG